MNYFSNTKQSGFTMLEFLIVTVVMAFLFIITVYAYNNYRFHQALKRDTEAVAAILREARNLTLVSKNATTYGVHLASTAVTLFTGASYSSSTPSNVVTDLSSGVQLSSDAVGDIVFARLTGQTNQAGTVTITLTSSVSTSTVKLYKTGVIER